jgi:hypothetical protein
VDPPNIASHAQVWSFLLSPSIQRLHGPVRRDVFDCSSRRLHTIRVAVRVVSRWLLLILAKVIIDTYSPGLGRPGLSREKVTMTGDVVAVPEVKSAFSQVGIPVI